MCFCVSLNTMSEVPSDFIILKRRQKTLQLTSLKISAWGLWSPQSKLDLKAHCMENKATCECKFWSFRARRRHLAAAVMDFQADPLSSGSQEEGQSITFPPREVEEGGASASAVHLLAHCLAPPHLVGLRASPVLSQSSSRTIKSTGASFYFSPTLRIVCFSGYLVTFMSPVRDFHDL